MAGPGVREEGHIGSDPPGQRHLLVGSGHRPTRFAQSLDAGQEGTRTVRAASAKTSARGNPLVDLDPAVERPPSLLLQSLQRFEGKVHLAVGLPTFHLQITGGPSRGTRSKIKVEFIEEIDGRKDREQLVKDPRHPWAPTSRAEVDLGWSLSCGFHRPS